ncbi:uncharacterized protein LOC116059917 [Sander lucioperca]|uniref:uncharacterized protein LOC116059917 n=1 Tax=Sander lucioperca TaxID=283035 RepID=UPI00125DDF79|nr:uncharacterized protein LOC116059917 [Sander lucioperca]
MRGSWNPDSLTPDSLTPDSLTPDALTPDSLTPDSLTPDALTPDSLTPDSLTPDSLTPDSLTPDSLTPDSLTPDSLTPDSLTPDSLTPDSLTPDSLTPDSTPAIGDRVRVMEGEERRAVGLVFGGGTPSFKEVTSSWFASEEGREAAVNHLRLNMNVRPTLICFFFLSLQDGNSGLTEAQIFVYTETEGEDIRVICPFPSSGNTKVFCKNGCKEKGDHLIETSNDTAQSGRYRIKYEELRSRAKVSVSISQLTRSDSGLYSCGLNGSTMLNVHFRIIVVDALLTGNPPGVKTFHKTFGDNVVVACTFSVSGENTYFCKERCKDKDILVQTSDLSAQRDRYSIEYVRGSPSGGIVYVTISQLTKSDSGLYRCRLDRPFSPDLYHEFRINVTDAPTTSEPNTTLAMFPSSVPSAFTPPHTETLSPRGTCTH